jgi:hypothetical protein
LAAFVSDGVGTGIDRVEAAVTGVKTGGVKVNLPGVGVSVTKPDVPVQLMTRRESRRIIARVMALGCITHLQNNYIPGVVIDYYLR